MLATSSRQKRLSPTEAAYLAGIIDGEGTVSFARRPCHSKDGKVRYYYGLMLHISSTDKAFMGALLAMVPYGDTCNIYEYKYKRERADKCKPAYRIMWRHHVAKDILIDCLPYLILKRRHAELVISMFNAMDIAQSERGGRGNAYPLWIHQMQEVISTEVALLNRRGNGA